MPTLDEIYKQFEDDAKLEYKRCSICGAWMNGISHTRSEKVCAELESLRADNAKLREALENTIKAPHPTWCKSRQGKVCNCYQNAARRVLEETSHEKS